MNEQLKEFEEQCHALIAENVELKTQVENYAKKYENLLEDYKEVLGLYKKLLETKVAYR